MPSALTLLERRRPSVIVAALGLTQIIGWGSLFSPLTVLSGPIGADIDASREVVFLGITLMLLVSALFAPRIGKSVDMHGARFVMMTGSVLAATSMVAMAVARGPATYLLAWALAGIAMPMMLTNAAMPGLVQAIGPNARRAITGLMLLSGLTSTIFLPLISLLADKVGWRGTYLAFAALHALICLPVHGLIMRRAPASELEMPKSRGSTSPPVRPPLPPERRRSAFLMLATWSCTEGLITWGLYLQVIDILQAQGIAKADAILIWMIVGPAQAAARLGELVLAHRHSIYSTAMASAVLTTASFLAILPFGVTAMTAVVFSLAIGLGHGLFAIARNTLPLTLFGAREYGSYMGRLMVPQNIVNAAAPVIFAWLISRITPMAAMWFAALAAFLGFIAVLFLIRACRPAAEPSTG